MRRVEPDLELLERWRNGDREAGESLFARYCSDIYRFFKNKVGLEAEELAQATFLAAVESRDQFRAQSSFRTFIFAIARHKLYDFLRAQTQAKAVDFEVTSLAEIVTSLASRLGRAQEVGRLRPALARLPAEQQLLLELHYWHELDARALAEVFDATPGAIRVRLLRARAALREGLRGTIDDLGDDGQDPISRSMRDLDAG